MTPDQTPLIPRQFLILPTMIRVLFGKAFFKKRNITIDPRKILLQLPDLTVQLNQIFPENGKKGYTKKLAKSLLILTKKVQISPKLQLLFECSLAKLSDQYKSCTSLVFPCNRLEDICSIALTSSVSMIDDKSKVPVSAVNFSDNQITLSKQTETAQFELLNEAQMFNLIEIERQLI